MRTQVGIIGAGPAGLMLARLLQLRGIDSVIVEAQSRAHIERRIRAGVLEQGTVDLLDAAGAGRRLHQLALVHSGVELRFDGRSHRIHLRELTGRPITIYGQHHLVQDLIGLLLESGADIHFEAGNVRIAEPERRPRIEFNVQDQRTEISCDFIAGCDGFQGISRRSVPLGTFNFYEQRFPFAWLGILAEGKPPSAELIYAHHQRGFALASMRSSELARYYLQCAPGEDIRLWPDDRVWRELHLRLALQNQDSNLQEGSVSRKSITELRSFVTEPMQYGNLFLVGDAAHIVPPTGAKGLNLAIADSFCLAQAIFRFYDSGSRRSLGGYSEVCLQRIWKIQRFCSWMTSTFHAPPPNDGFEFRRQLAELNYLVSSKTASALFAETYTGLPLSPGME